MSHLHNLYLHTVCCFYFFPGMLFYIPLVLQVISLPSAHTLHDVFALPIVLNGSDFTSVFRIDTPVFSTTFTFNPAFLNILRHMFASSPLGVVSTKKTACDPSLLNQFRYFDPLFSFISFLLHSLLLYSGCKPSSFC